MTRPTPRTGRRLASIAALPVILVASTLLSPLSAAEHCGQIALPDLSSAPLQHGRSTLPDFGGCWSPDLPDEGTPVRYTGVNGELLGNIALFLQPRTITIANHNGQLRRIAILEPDAPPARLDTSAPGSVAYWEGQTLVVRSVALDPGTGGHVRVVERIGLSHWDTLEYALLVLRPEEPTRPLSVKVFYHRAAEPMAFPQARPDSAQLIAYQE